MTPKFLKPNSFPYYQGSTPNLNMSTKDKISMIGLIKQRYNFMKFAKIKSTSEWLYRELSNIDDGNSETPWQGDRLWWYNHKSESLTIDLSTNKNINSVVWQNWHLILSPIGYNIEVSNDNKNWKIVKIVDNGEQKKDAFWTVDNFPTVNARWVKINYTKTISDDSPAISEIYIANISDLTLNANLLQDFEQNPFYYVIDENE